MMDETCSTKAKFELNYTCVVFDSIGVVYLNINQPDALNFIMSLFHACTCFEHTCSSSGG